MSDVQKALQEMGEKLHEMRKANDEVLAAKASGESVSLLETKLAATEQSLGEVLAQIKALEKANGRRGMGGHVADEAKQEHAAALMKFIRKGEEAGLAELEQKAVSVGVQADGGFALTDEMDTSIGELVRDLNPMRSVCRVMQVGNETYSKLFNQGGAASGWVGETAARPETASPTLSKVTPFFGEIYANPATTQKALDDLFFDAAAWLNTEVAEEFADEENLAFTSGNGAAKPKGILAYTFSAAPTFGQIKFVPSTVTGSFAADDFITLQHAIKQGYRGRGVYMMNDLTLAAARKLKDGQGNYIWQASFTAGKPSTILGHNVVENHDMPALAVAANAVLFGDFQRAYTILDVRGTRILRDPFTNKPYVHFYTTKRVGGGLMDSRALASMQPKA